MAGRGDPPPTPRVARVRSPAPSPAPSRPRRRAGPPDYRPGRPEDAPACAEIWAASIADYERRLGRTPIPVDLGPVTRLIEHLAATDPDRFPVAERRGRIVGFGQASVRGELWFLGLLFVLPGEQGTGVGRELLARTLPGGRLPGRGERWIDVAPAGAPAILGTTTDAAQPISNALYAGLGIIPRSPAFRYVGRPDRPGALGPLPDGATLIETTLDDPATDATAALATLDRGVLGADRPAEHAFYRADGRRLYLARTAGGGTLGYGYVTPAGRLGPVAAATPELLVPLVGALLEARVPAGPSSLAVCGENPALARALLEAGFRLDGFPALICWDRPFAALDRYLLGSYALP